MDKTRSQIPFVETNTILDKEKVFERVHKRVLFLRDEDGETPSNGER